MNKKIIDLSDIKSDELDKTASFTDLMSRSERKARKRLKEEESILNNNIIDKEVDDNINALSLIEDESIDKKDLNVVEEISLDNNELNISEIDDNIDLDDEKDEYKVIFDDDKENILDIKDDNRHGISNNIIMGIMIILSIIYLVYSIIFTNQLNNQRYMIIDASILVGMIFMFGISIMCKRTCYIFFSVLNYLLLIGYLVFNIMLNMGYIK